MADHDAQIPISNVAGAQASLPQNQATEPLQVGQVQAVPQVVADQPTTNVVAGGTTGEDVAGNLEALLQRIKCLEEAQGSSVNTLIRRITHYGSRRIEDFDKYSALHVAEELASVAKTSSHPQATSYDIITSTLRDKMHVPTEQFKAYFLALLADKEFTSIIETVSKVDKSFNRSKPYPTTPARRTSPSTGVTSARIICYRCGTPGHKSPQCWIHSDSNRQSSRPDRRYTQQH